MPRLWPRRAPHTELSLEGLLRERPGYSDRAMALYLKQTWCFRLKADGATGRAGPFQPSQLLRGEVRFRHLHCCPELLGGEPEGLQDESKRKADVLMERRLLPRCDKAALSSPTSCQGDLNQCQFLTKRLFEAL